MERGRPKIKSILRRARRRFLRGAVILAYHRIADLDFDPHHLAVSPSHFAQHVDHLKKTCTLMPLQDLGKALLRGNLPPRAVAVTFDDGYLDVLERAHPILRAARTPATVFVPSGLVGEQREFWYDELDRLLLCAERLPKKLNLSIGGQSCAWDTVSPGQIKSVFWDVWNRLKSLRHDERTEVLDELQRWTGQERKCREGYRPMNAGELYRLSQEGWEIGGHTITHAVLSQMKNEDQYSEIARGREMLSDILGRPISAFAYPHGSNEDFTAETVAIVKKAGFSLGCTMLPGSVKSGDDLFRLNRYAVLDWPLDIFVMQLDSFFSSRGKMQRVAQAIRPRWPHFCPTGG
ncbi:MAG TPA: polysaccharide deacetylase family protein [Syntrophorhabdaceae bacterium]|jgi:peptidoglycan/xylan/chitin deacetylase (PgdA/CDA1 family)